MPGPMGTRNTGLLCFEKYRERSGQVFKFGRIIREDDQLCLIKKAGLYQGGETIGEIQKERCNWLDSDHDRGK